jgi:ribonucleoside-diphosphate reductase subunit M2
MVSSFWVIEEIDVSKDLADWNDKLNDDERFFIKNVLSFFAASDLIVNENLIERFCKEVQVPEAKFVYGFQIAMENVHSETYALLLDTYVTDADEKERCLHAITTIPCIKKKADWALKWIHDSGSSFAKRLVCFAVVEGLLFSSSFASIYWLKKRGLMPGLTASNELISRDEGMHTDFACLLYSHIVYKLHETEVHAIFREAVAIEKEFIIESLPCALLGMNSKLMATYIDYVADRLLLQLGYAKMFNASNPFDFMILGSLQQHVNFFESRNLNYSKAMVGVSKDNESHLFGTDADF